MNNDYIGFVDKILTDVDLSQEKKAEIKDGISSTVHDIEKKFDLEKKFSIGIKVVFSLAILALFAMSYYFSFDLINKILTVEVDLMTRNLLKAEGRSINTVTVSALLAATVTQTGIAFYTVTKYLFKEK